MSAYAYRQTFGANTIGGKLLKRRFDYSVLQRMESYDRHASAAFYQSENAADRVVQSFKLAVDFYPHRLERLFGRVPALTVRHRRADYIGKLRSAFDRFLNTASYYLAGYSPRKTFFAVLAQNIRQLLRRITVDYIVRAELLISDRKSTRLNSSHR